jgi:serine/threonine-protein kinase
VIDRERWHEVDRLLGQVLELPPEARAELLDRTCEAGSEVRREVERLLAADAANRTFLEEPIGEVLGFSVQGRDRDKGLGLGPYKLLERLHSGGMGTVYRAVRDDQQFEQQVAIKILRLGLETTEALHRFRAERQILARLKHPNIARLYDGGSTADGRPFLVMELIEGHPIDEFCDRVRLTLEGRLTLFRKVCDAVHYAHQNLLVHRDLKPDNILVTADGEPKLLDFGIAKQLEPPGERGAPGLTRTGVRPMTPIYASPEQVRGEAITTASDVYALGVLLYQLLAGRSPYRTTTGLPHEVERAVCEQEPERLSAGVVRPEPAVEAWEGAAPAEEIAAARRLRVEALRRRLSGDLENIVAMALRKEPSRRYASVAALSQDLEQYLQNQPVAARPDSALYRTKKFLRRHRMGAGVAAGVCLVVLGLLIGLAEQGRRLARERDKARNALSFLVDVFKNADPYKTGGAHLSARDILDRGAEQVRQGLGRQPEVQAALMDAIGQVDVGLGGVREAEPLLTGALALRQRTLGPRAPETLDTLEHLARLRYDQSDFAAAERLLRRALAEKRRRLASDDPALASTLTRLGEVLVTKGVDRAKEAEGLYAEALAIYRKSEGPDGPTVAKTRIYQARLEDARGDYGRAESLFREGLEIEKRRLGAADPTYLSDLASFSDVLHDAGKDREAEASLRQVIGLQERALGKDHPDLAVALNSLALLLHMRGAYVEAESLYRRVLALLRAHYGDSTVMVSSVLNNLASTVQAQVRTREAIALHEECLAVRRKILGEDSQEVAQSTLLLAAAHRDLKEYAQAEALAKRALEILRKRLGPSHPLVGYPLRDLGRTYLAAGKPAEAEPYLRECLEIRRKTLAPGSPEISKAEVTLGVCLTHLRRFSEAEALLQHAYAQLARTLPPTDMRVCEAKGTLANLYGSWGRPEPRLQTALHAPKEP